MKMPRTLSIGQLLRELKSGKKFSATDVEGKDHTLTGPVQAGTILFNGQRKGIDWVEWGLAQQDLHGQKTIDVHEIETEDDTIETIYVRYAMDSLSDEDVSREDALEYGELLARALEDEYSSAVVNVELHIGSRYQINGQFDHDEIAVVEQIAHDTWIEWMEKK